jgi:hypothetical protein
MDHGLRFRVLVEDDDGLSNKQTDLRDLYDMKSAYLSIQQ